MKSTQKILALVAIFLELVLTASPLQAQEVSGTFTGIATESHNGPLPNFDGQPVTGTFFFLGSLNPFDDFAFVSIAADGDQINVGDQAGNLVPNNFSASVYPTGQTVMFGSYSEHAIAEFTLTGGPNAFGPNSNLTSTTFHPGKAFLWPPAASTLYFNVGAGGTIGATVDLTGLTMCTNKGCIASPVPEPASTQFMLCGLGLLAFVTYRQKSGRINRRMSS